MNQMELVESKSHLFLKHLTKNNSQEIQTRIK